MPQPSPLPLLLLLLCISEAVLCYRTSGLEHGTTRSPSCVRHVPIGGQEVHVRRNLGLGIRQVFLLRIQRLFKGFPALTQLRVDGGISCSTPSKGSCCLERREHLFENAAHLAGLRICRPGEILLRQRQHVLLLGFRAHTLERATLRLHDVMHRLRNVKHLHKVSVVLSSTP